MTRIVPNSYQKPNLYTDKLMRFLTGDEWKTLDYAMRRTFGFNKDVDRISITQFMNGNGRVDENGDLLEYGTGLSREDQVNALNELKRFGILVELAPNNAQKHGRLWKLQLNEDELRFDLLQERAASRLERGRKRTAKARHAALEAHDGAQNSQAADIGLTDRPVEPVCPTDRYRSVLLTDTGLTNRPVLVCPTDPQKHSRKTERKTGETQLPEEAAEAPLAEAWRALVALCNGEEATASAVWQLQEKFAAVTQLKRPNPATPEGRTKLEREWWPHLLQVLAEADNNVEAAEAAVQEAVRVMVQRDRPLNVVAPRSIVNVAAGVLAGRRRGDSGRSVALQQRPKGMGGIDAYADRRGLKHGN